MYQQTILGDIPTIEHSMASFLPSYRDFYEHPEQYRVEPFRIFGNLYYVGNRKACPHLIDTGEGLILMDTGYGIETEFLMDNIRTLGFRVEDVKIIIHTHGHFDHFGGTDAIRSVSGATVCMSRVDTELIQQMPARALTHLAPVPMEIPHIDRLLEDGDHIRLGNTDITCLLSPGHTFGTMSFLFDVTDGTETYRAGYLGGAGFLTVYKAYCAWYGLPQTKCQAMKQTIARLLQERVDITLGNHPNQNNTLGKRAYMLEHPGTNPFVDPEGWTVMLRALEEKRQKFEDLGY